MPPGSGSLAEVLASAPGAMIPPRSEAMQLRLDLGGSAAPAAALWELVSPEQRQTAMTLLAALIARTVAGEGALDDRASLRGPSAPGERDD